MSSSERIDDFIQALQDEVEAIKEKKSGYTNLSNGTLIAQVGNSYVYSFTSARLFVGEEDTPAIVEIDGKKHDCSVVSMKGLEIQLAVNTPLAEVIPAARVTNERWGVLLRLVERLRENKKTGIFEFSEQVFSGQTRQLTNFNKRAEYSWDEETAPNSSQAEAIHNSFRNSLAVIWGPPGTGKTRTIARAVEAHVLAGRRVLLVSHANAAVDAALEDIAEQLAETLYKQGKIIRAGVPKDKSLATRFPLVIPENAARAQNESIIRERDALEAQAKPLETFEKQCKRLIKAADLVRTLERKIQRPEGDVQVARLKQIQGEIAQAQADIAHVASIGSPVNLETFVYDRKIFIATRQRFVDELTAKIEAKTATAVDLNRELDDANAIFEAVLQEAPISPNYAEKELAAAQARLKPIYEKIESIDKEIAARQGKILNEAQIVGMTLTKTFNGPVLDNQKFDVLVVDEASMVPQPFLYWALTKAKQAVLVGDFNQLPPIVSAQSAMAKRCLGASIFDALDINTVEKAQANPLVSLLDMQYRMAPQIASVSSHMFYGGLLSSAPNTNNLGFHDSIFGDNRLVIVDTSAVDPWVARAQQGSFINIYNAGVVTRLAERLLAEHPEITLGIASPYRPQANFIASALKTNDVGDRTTVSTVHKFQGGESTAIIFDCVEGKGMLSSMLNDSGNSYPQSGTRSSGKANIGANAGVLLNVAMTRARALFIIVVNSKHFMLEQRQSTLCRLLEVLGPRALTLSSRDLDDGYFARPLEAGSQTNFAPPNARLNPASALHTEKDFWPAFRQDLATAQHDALIVSPFLTSKRSQQFYEQFENLLSKKVKVVVFTKPIEEHADHMLKEAEAVVRQLEKIGVEVVQRSKIHHKVVVIDDLICWEGSLNILSQRDSLEHMRRFQNQAIAREIRRNLQL